MMSLIHGDQLAKRARAAASSSGNCFSAGPVNSPYQWTSLSLTRSVPNSAPGPHTSVRRPSRLVSGMTARQLVLPEYRGRAAGNSWPRTVLWTPSAATTRSHSRACSPAAARQVTAAGSPPGGPGPDGGDLGPGDQLGARGPGGLPQHVVQPAAVNAADDRAPAVPVDPQQPPAGRVLKARVRGQVPGSTDRLREPEGRQRGHPVLRDPQARPRLPEFRRPLQHRHRPARLPQGDRRGEPRDPAPGHHSHQPASHQASPSCLKERRDRAPEAYQP